LLCQNNCQGHDGLAIDCIAISENGYHVATTSSSSSPNNNNNNNSPIHIWDLRKLKLSATITPADDVGTVMSLAFDPTASYLAYSGEVCTKICVAKDWDRVVCTLTPSKKGAAKKGKKAPSAGSVGKLSGAVVWGGEGFGLKEGEGGNVWLAVGCDGERPVRFWGLE
jgi:WD40 repeat protein